MADYNKNGINIPVGYDLRGLQTGSEQAATILKDSGQKMSDAVSTATNKSNNSLKSLQQAYRATYKDAQILAQQQGLNSQAFQEAAKKAAEYKDTLEDVQDALKAASPEQKWKLVGSAVSAATDMAQGFVGVMSLIGIETNKAEKYIQAMMSLQAISGAVNAVFQLSDAYKALTASMVSAGTAANGMWASILKPLAIAAAAVAAFVAMIPGAGAGSDLGMKKISEMNIDEIIKNAKIEHDKATDAAKNHTKQIKELTWEYEKYSDKINEMKERLATFKNNYSEGFDLQGESDITPLIEKQAGAYDKLAESIGNAANQHESLMQSYTQLSITMDVIASAISDFVDKGVSAAMSGGDIGKALMSSLLGSMGDFMKAWGAELILVGLGAEALKASLSHLDGIGAIAAGIALVAAGSAASSMASSFANSGGNMSTSGSQNSYQPAQYNNNYRSGFGNNEVYIDGIVRGNNIVIALNNQQRQNKRIR